MVASVDLPPTQESLPVQDVVVKTDLTNSHGLIAIPTRAVQVMLFKMACANFSKIFKKFENFSKIPKKIVLKKIPLKMLISKNAKK